jgi:HEAT repeat protein
MTRPRRSRDERERFVPDSEAPEPRYDEPEPSPPDDRMPPAERAALEGPSPAHLRLQAEQLLQRREAAAPEAWAALGNEVRQLLPRMLDDVAVQRHDAVRQKLIATLGQLEIPAAIPRLGEILSDREESATTRAFAANALGRLADPQVVALLARAVGDKDEMVRRQVARALGATDHPDAVAHLMAMKDDPSAEVAQTASEELLRYETTSGTKLGGRSRPARRAKGKRKPAADSDADPDADRRRR